VFELDLSAAKVSTVFVKKTKPGLSSYANDPAAAVGPLLKLLVEGSKTIPDGLSKWTPLVIFGTAGMRMLPLEQQNAVWKAVQSGLVSDQQFPFEDLSARTVTGSEEGLWALFTANFLAGRMSHDLTSHGKDTPIGLMDLGGSSTQIAIPASSAAKQGAQFAENAIVHSYLGFGMTHLREEVRKHKAGVDAACYMRGTEIEANLYGTGDATSCRKIIRDMVTEQSHACQADDTAEKPCLGDLAHVPEAVDAITMATGEFYAVAGMTYVVDFVRWWLELSPDTAEVGRSFLDAYPKPSLVELTHAVDTMCSGDYAPIAARTADKKLAHPFTGFDNGPYRCFQANYILILLGEMYGFKPDGRTVTFALDVQGEDLEWPLGALLHARAQRGSRKEL